VICHRCRRDFTGEHSWLRVERGVVLPDGQVAHADRNYCCPEHWAADLTAPTKETSAP
jgi:hypothetical protein